MSPIHRKDRAASAFEYCVEMGASNIGKHTAMSVAAFSVTALCLLLIGALVLLSANARRMIRDFQAENAMLAFIDDSMNDTQKKQTMFVIEDLPGVRKVEYITKEEAFQKYRDEYGAGDSNYLSAAVFRDRYAIEVSKGSSLVEVKESVSHIDGIAEVRTDEAITNGFQSAQRLIRLVGLTGSALMVIASVVIVINTLKLTVMNRKDEYEVMLMMGADDKFFKLPLLVEGSIIGGFAALAAFIISLGIYSAVTGIISRSGMSKLFEIAPISTVAFPLLGVMLVCGIAIGIGGSLIAGRRATSGV